MRKHSNCISQQIVYSNNNINNVTNLWEYSQDKQSKKSILKKNRHSFYQNGNAERS